MPHQTLTFQTVWSISLNQWGFVSNNYAANFRWVSRNICYSWKIV